MREVFGTNFHATQCLAMCRLPPSKRSQPVTADISSALQASFLPKVFLSWGLSKKHADTLLTHLIFLPL